jgi:nucleoid-associated protein YgaU
MRSISPTERHSEPVPLEEAAAVPHVFVEGETLSHLAHRFYGDWRLWKDIADYNGVTDPRRVAVGTRLLIPPRRLQDGRFESV